MSATGADRLYDLPLDEFTAARNALSSELKKAGRREEADEVASLRKPSQAAWIANQLARRHRGELDAFLEAARRLRRAQLGGADIREATRAERDALERLVKLAGEYGVGVQLARVRGTLQAAAVDEDAAAAVRAGRLERELAPAGFGSLVLETPPPRRRRADPAAKRTVAEARKRVEELRHRAAAAADEARRREAEWQRAEHAARDAADRLAEAEAALAEAEARLERK